MSPPRASNDSTGGPPDPLHAGRAALSRGDWDAARRALRSAVEHDPTDPAAWESLGVACMWLQETERVLTARQKAYALYRERGDDTSAARLCLDLVGDFLDLRGEPAVATGWLERGRRLLADREPTAEHAYLRIWDTYMAINGDAGPAVARARAGEAVAIAEEVGAKDLGVLGLALQGLALVGEGHVRRGMRLLDEAAAAALGGELSDLQAICLTCCCMIDACEQVRDYGRALQWCERLRDVSTRWGVQSFLTTCRIKYSGVLLWRGDWGEAEQELDRALAELSAATPAAVSGVLARLAELRRRQGRRTEAEALLGRAGSHPLGLPVRAALALEAGDPATTVDLVESLLRRMPASARTERARALELLARARAALGQTDRAEEAVTELEGIASAVDTEPLRATALAARGELAAIEGEAETARSCFADAVFLFEASGSRYEAARARLGMSRALATLGRGRAASAEAAASLAALERLGAATAAGRARDLLERVRKPGAKRGAGASPLTPRQHEVLELVARGLSDREIAERLFISEYTVHRHVSNILTRLDATSRTAAVAKAIRTGLV